MSFTQVVNSFSPDYVLKLITSPMGPNGPMNTTNFRYPQFSKAAKSIETQYPNGIYLMIWFDTAQISDGSGQMFFLRYRGIT